MNRKEAENYVVLVNSKPHLDALEKYANYRTEVLKNNLLLATSIEEVRKLQGAVEELSRFKTLRQEVLNTKD